ncbi:uncharacterized protein [Leptinotarsa decemlineata]|uniref:uncharacterized protein n=1 Tax=Leptinotarsa decemlineata TaxID=7539 RepID=UPI003D309788
MFLVPINIQENLTCDFCHKFLTVGPVKVYPDKKMKCGRCPQSTNDGGTISIYSQIAQLGVFKCFNRFDGCNNLLGYHEVRDHEENCESRAYLCPECPETVNVPTFLMIKHFQDNHDKRFLQKSCFELNLDGLHQTETYLHGIEDNLFFVECRNNSSESFYLRTVLLGDQNRAETVTQQFAVRYDNLLKEIVTERKPCDSASSEISVGFQISKQALYSHQQVIIEFQLDLTGSLALVPLPSTFTEESQQPLDLDSILAPRKIKLSNRFQDNHPNYSVNTNGISITRALEGAEPLEILPHCYNCSHPFTPGESYVKLDSNKYQWVCWRCEEYCRKKNPDLKFLSYEEISPDCLEGSSLFSCTWRCEKKGFYDKILNHERYCSKIPKQACPIKNCQMRGTIDRLRPHFEEFHPEFRIKFGSLVKIECPATFPNVERWFVWFRGCFVPLVIIWEDSCRCTVEIHKSAKVCDKFNGGALIFPNKYSSYLCVATTENVCVVKKCFNFFFIKLFIMK